MSISMLTLLIMDFALGSMALHYDILNSNVQFGFRFEGNSVYKKIGTYISHFHGIVVAAVS